MSSPMLLPTSKYSVDINHEPFHQRTAFRICLTHPSGQAIPKPFRDGNSAPTRHQGLEQIRMDPLFRHWCISQPDLATL